MSLLPVVPSKMRGAMRSLGRLQKAEQRESKQGRGKVSKAEKTGMILCPGD